MGVEYKSKNISRVHVKNEENKMHGPHLYPHLYSNYTHRIINIVPSNSLCCIYNRQQKFIINLMDANKYPNKKSITCVLV